MEAKRSCLSFNIKVLPPLGSIFDPPKENSLLCHSFPKCVCLCSYSHTCMCVHIMDVHNAHIYDLFSGCIFATRPLPFYYTDCVRSPLLIGWEGQSSHLCFCSCSACCPGDERKDGGTPGGSKGAQERQEAGPGSCAQASIRLSTRCGKWVDREGFERKFEGGYCTCFLSGVVRENHHHRNDE